MDSITGCRVKLVSGAFRHQRVIATRSPNLYIGHEIYRCLMQVRPEVIGVGLFVLLVLF